MNKIYSLLTCFQCLLFVSNPALHGESTPPSHMVYQGFLTDALGVPLGNESPGAYDLTFRIHDTESGGSPFNVMWAEDQTVVINNGHFSVILGEGSEHGSEPHPGLHAVFIGENSDGRFLGTTITANGEAREILPRLRLVSTAYSFLANYANSAGRIVGQSGDNLLVSQGGNIGVGDDNPDHTLTVGGDIHADGGISMQGDLSVQSVSPDGSMSPVLQTAAGKVGIGVSVPTASPEVLGVLGDVKVEGNLSVDNGSINVKPGFGESGLVVHTPDGTAVQGNLSLGVDAGKAYLSPSGGRPLNIESSVVVSGSLQASGTLKHAGVNLTDGDNIDQIHTFVKSLTVGSSWIHTGIISHSLPEGTYIMQLTFDNGSAGGRTWSGVFSGVVAWRNQNTNDDVAYDIPLSKAGHAFNNDDTYLRWNLRSGGLPGQLQIRHRYSNPTTTYTFKFRRMF